MSKTLVFIMRTDRHCRDTKKLLSHHLRMELAGTYISEGFGVICACVNAKEDAKLYKLSNIFCVNCEC